MCHDFKVGAQAIFHLEDWNFLLNVSKVFLMNSSPHFVERWTGRTLRFGVWASGAFMVVGLGLISLQPIHSNVPAALPTFEELVSGFFSRSVDALTIVNVGLVLLMTTPLLRVFTAILGFTAEKDWKYSGVALVVFLMLAGELVYSLQ